MIKGQVLSEVPVAESRKASTLNFSSLNHAEADLGSQEEFGGFDVCAYWPLVPERARLAILEPDHIMSIDTTNRLRRASKAPISPTEIRKKIAGLCTEAEAAAVRTRSGAVHAGNQRLGSPQNARRHLGACASLGGNGPARSPIVGWPVATESVRHLDLVVGPDQVRVVGRWCRLSAAWSGSSKQEPG